MGNTLYEQDFHAWTLQQAELLRRRQLDCADLDNIADRATIEAERETGLAAGTFPESCPFSFDQTINDAFWPDD
jgi:hypothetical protein